VSAEIELDAIAREAAFREPHFLQKAFPHQPASAANLYVTHY